MDFTVLTWTTIYMDHPYGLLKKREITKKENYLYCIFQAVFKCILLERLTKTISVKPHLVGAPCLEMWHAAMSLTETSYQGIEIRH